MATLRVISGPAAGRSLSIDQRTVIGRADADLTIDDDQLSRHHVAIEPNDEGVVVEDLGSTNGTFVDGQRIAGRVTVTESAVLRVGSSEFEIDVPVGNETRLTPRLAEQEAEQTAVTPRVSAEVSAPAESAAPMATLSVRSGPAGGQTIAIDRSILIGRRDADLTIADPNVSTRHAELRPSEHGVVVEDLGSMNGTFVDGERITDSVTLTQDATLRVGNSEIALEFAAPVAQPEPDTGGTEVRGRFIAEPADVTLARPAQPVAPSPPAAQAPADPLPDAPPDAAPSPVAAPPPEAPPGTARPPRPRAPRRQFVISGLILLVAAAIVVALVVAQSGKSRHTHPLQNTLRTAILTQSGLSFTFLGLQTGPPTGTGTATLDQTFVPPRGKPPLGLGVPTKFTAKVISRYDDGSVTSIVTGTATRQPDTSVKVVGHGTIVSGTGTYKGATGSFSEIGGRPPHSDRAVFKLVGSIRY